MMVWIWILWISLIVLIIWGVRVFIGYTESRGKSVNQHKSVVDILRERYAKGEIDRQEFEERKKALSQ